MDFVKGQKIKIGSSEDANIIKFNCFDNRDVDYSIFVLDENDKLISEDYLIFYNQLKSIDNSIIMNESYDSFKIDIKKLNSNIKKILICASCDDSKMYNDKISLFVNDENKGDILIENTEISCNKSLIVSEVYIKNNDWRVSVSLNVFSGGLEQLVEFYGAEVDKTENAEVNDIKSEHILNNSDLTQNRSNNYIATEDKTMSRINAEEKSGQGIQDNSNVKCTIDLAKKERIQKIVLEKAPHLIDLTKKVTVILEKKNIANEKSAVVVALDNSGSMYGQYQKGDLQKALDKLLPIALMLDDNETLDSWAFASKVRHLTEITLDNINNYLENERWKKWKIGYGNDEPKIMKEIINEYKDSEIPVYVVFISDGGIYATDKIKQLLINSSSYPIFWQFLGIGGKDYGILEELDDMEGRVVDNADFFAIDKINSLSDEELYNKLLTEYPNWIKEARSKNILK